MSYTMDEWDQDADFDRWYCDETGRRVRERLDMWRARTVLEVGCAQGRMTAQLVNPAAVIRRRILAMDLDEAMLGRAQERDLPDVEWVHGNVLDLAPRGRALRPFEAIVCCSVLHEAPNPRAILQKCYDLLAPRGRVIVTVPNADSVHRSLAGGMSERARRFGVRRELSMGEWHSLLITGTGLKVAQRFGFVLKPYENARMESLTHQVLDHLAAYTGPGSALCWFELEAAV